MSKAEQIEEHLLAAEDALYAADDPSSSETTRNRAATRSIAHSLFVVALGSLPDVEAVAAAADEAIDDLEPELADAADAIEHHAGRHRPTLGLPTLPRT